MLELHEFSDSGQPVSSENQSERQVCILDQPRYSKSTFGSCVESWADCRTLHSVEVATEIRRSVSVVVYEWAVCLCYVLN